MITELLARNYSKQIPRNKIWLLIIGAFFFYTCTSPESTQSPPSTVDQVEAVEEARKTPTAVD